VLLIAQMLGQFGVQRRLNGQFEQFSG
jgi:hypothetical protein